MLIRGMQRGSPANHRDSGKDNDSVYDRSGDEDEWDPDGCEDCGRVDCDAFLERQADAAAQANGFGVAPVVI